jgi:NAD(P)-dependent dehydrogenase (short-subunit alcohol dehydrogenase family)
MGHAIAKSFVQEGCTRIVISDINPAALEQTVSTLQSINPSVDILHSVTDVSNPQAVDALFQQIAARFGRIDYAVNNAGIMGPFSSTSEMTVEEFDKVTSVNYRGVWLCEKKELEMMKTQDFLPGSEGARRSRGSIVNIASQLGVVGRSNARTCASLHSLLSHPEREAVSPFQRHRPLVADASSCILRVEVRSDGFDSMRRHRSLSIPNPGQRRVSGHHWNTHDDPPDVPRTRRGPVPTLAQGD